MKSIQQALADVGFTSGEAELYEAVLALGKPSVTELARKLEKNRAAVHFHLKSLLKKGLVRETREGRKFRFVALPPKNLADLVEQRLVDLKSLVPQLMRLDAAEAETPLIEVTESAQGFHRVYDEIASLPEGSDFCVIEGRNALKEELPLLSEEQWYSFFSRILKRSIETKAIFTEESLLQPGKQLSQENLSLLEQRVFHVRVLSEAVLPFQDLMLVYGDKIAFLFPESALVVAITHRRIAQAMRTLFDTLFVLGRPVKEPWK